MAKGMNVYLGIDVGSISTNLVVVAANGDVLYTLYDRGEGNPIRSIQESLRRLEAELPAGMVISGVCATGSGGRLVAAVVGADLFKNEITAHARASIHLHPDVQTILEIGGQDSKLTIVRDRLVVDFSMNLVCAAGTGSFLDSQAKRLGISIEELSAAAVLSRSPTAIAGRCTVFAESDMIHKQQAGHRRDDILMGLCQAMVRNFLSNVCRGKKIEPPVVFQGGVSANQGIRRAFAEALQMEVLVPKYSMVMGAYGAALLAAQAGIAKTAFRGFAVVVHRIETRSLACSDCANNCELLEIVDEGDLLRRTGGRCRKWDRSHFRGSGPAIAPDAPPRADAIAAAECPDGCAGNP
jgi:predicted CoA-substrate-specific enzyme activase